MIEDWIQADPWLAILLIGVMVLAVLLLPDP
jgi:hypothetical protein